MHLAIILIFISLYSKFFHCTTAKKALSQKKTKAAESPFIAMPGS